MKKLLILSFLALTFSAISQTEKGKQVIGGTGMVNLGFGGNKALTKIKLAPSYGYFIANRWLVEGLFSSEINFISPNYYSNNFGLGFNTRYYIPLAKRLSMYAEMGVSVNQFKLDYLGVIKKHLYIKPTAALGLEYWFGERWSVFAKFQVSQQNNEIINSSTRYWINVPVGIHYYFGKPKPTKGQTRNSLP